MNSIVVSKEVEIDAAAARVWHFVGTEVGLQKWWLPHRITLEARLGGRYEERSVTAAGMGFRLSGSVLAYDPPRRIEMSCRLERDDGVSWPEATRISMTLTKISGRTRVSVAHGGFERLPEAVRREALASHEAGWERLMKRLGAIVLPLETTVRQRILGSRPAVFRALIEPDALAGWFCDTAVIEPAPGGRYAFGGSHAYGGPEVMRGRIVQLDKDRALSFIWPLSGVDTTVAIELREISARETEVTVHHSGVTVLPVEWASPEHLTAVWQILLRQLDASLRDRPLPRYDFSRTPPPVVDQTITIAAPPARIWDMLTVPSLMNRWISTDAHVELEVGGRYSFGWDEEGPRNSGPLRILALEPPRRLVISWREAGAIGTVTWRLEPAGPEERSTRLRLVHEGVGALPGILRDYSIGWWEFLIRLPDLAAA